MDSDGENEAEAHVFDDDASGSEGGSVVNHGVATGGAADESSDAKAEAKAGSHGGTSDAESDASDVEDDGSVLAAAPYSYASIVRPATEARVAAKAWLARVHVDGPGSVASVLSIVVDAARPGCGVRREAVTVGMICSSGEKGASVAAVCDGLAGDEVDRGKYFGRAGRVRYASFWKALVEEAEDAMLYDTDCFETLVEWLVSFAGAASRPLRYAACVAAYALIDGAVVVGKKLRADLGTVQRQLATEEKKRGGGGGGSGAKGRRGGGAVTALSACAKDLRKKVDTLTANDVELTDLTDTVFTSIFVLRYRDVSVDVRVASLLALGRWTLAYPEHFLDDTHNKYIGWLLFDKHPAVRRAALGVLLDLFGEPKFIGGLDMFSRNFMRRIVQMTSDKDVDVCVSAISLCTVFAKSQVFEDKHQDALCLLAVSEHPDIRRAAGGFAAALVELAAADDDGDVSDDGDDDSDKPGGSQSLTGLASKKKAKRKTPKKKKKPAAAKGRKRMGKLPALAFEAENMDVEKAKSDLREIIFAVIADSSGDDKAGALVLDSVWEYLPAVHCWSAYAKLLLDHAEATSGKGLQETIEVEDALSSEDMVSVAAMLVSAAKHAEEAAKEALNKKKGRGKGGPVSEERDAMTLCFIPLLPKLLALFGTDAKVLTLLCELPRYFNLSASIPTGGTGHFKKLLSKLGEIVVRSTGSPPVILVAAHSLKKLASGEGTLASSASLALSKEASGAARALHSVVRTGVGKAALETVRAALVRATVLSELIELPADCLDDAIDLLRGLCDGASSMTGLRSQGVNICRLVVKLLMWHCRRLLSCVIPEDDAGLDEDVAEEAVREFAVRRDEILGLLARILSSESEDGELVRLLAFKAACVALSLSARMYHKLTGVAASSAEDARGPVVSLSKQTISLLRVEGDDDSIFSFLRSTFLQVVAASYGEIKATVDRRWDKGDVLIFPTNIERERTESLTALTQVAVTGDLPTHVMHLPLLGLLLTSSADPTPDNAGVMVQDLARVYFDQLRATLSSEEVVNLESQALLDCVKIDSVNGESGYASLRAVRSLATVFAKGTNAESTSPAKCYSLIDKLLSVGLNTATSASQEPSELRRSVACAAGEILASRISRSSAKVLLSRIERELGHLADVEGDDDDEDDSDEDVDKWPGVAAFCASVTATAAGNPKPLQSQFRPGGKRSRGKAKGGKSRVKRNKSMRAPAKRKKQSSKSAGLNNNDNNDGDGLSEATDSHLNVRRSGRVRRTTAYLEAESEGSDEESDEESEEDSGEESEEDSGEESEEERLIGESASVGRGDPSVEGADVFPRTVVSEAEDKDTGEDEELLHSPGGDSLFEDQDTHVVAADGDVDLLASPIRSSSQRNSQASRGRTGVPADGPGSASGGNCGTAKTSSTPPARRRRSAVRRKDPSQSSPATQPSRGSSASKRSLSPMEDSAEPPRKSAKSLSLEKGNPSSSASLEKVTRKSPRVVSASAKSVQESENSQPASLDNAIRKSQLENAPEISDRTATPKGRKRSSPASAEAPTRKSSRMRGSRSSIEQAELGLSPSSKKGDATSQGINEVPSTVAEKATAMVRRKSLPSPASPQLEVTLKSRRRSSRKDSSPEAVMEETVREVEEIEAPRVQRSKKGRRW